ncbi:NAD(P)-dependent alcohol dehydrogenase [Paludisphaera rhizosphaerae]|uniref:NAD(P)-dependent alcohol dehydrogenase n=1 Tax=Paludisphaera rhizosphaerae TaxID=2711216 RepID=UPI0028F428C7|nr:NAD(P)-dependent alcohol dehydrogenase [Paludisphaera rhizosphaerae]
MRNASDESRDGSTTKLGRREFAVTGASLALTPMILGGAVAAAHDGSNESSSDTSPIKARAYGSTRADSPIGPMQIERRAVGPNDVLLDVLYCGICHSDVHQARNEWSSWNPTQYPCVPGHEIIGRVRAVGKNVTKFKVGDVGGVGCMVDSCGKCEGCLDDREQTCTQPATFTYNSPDLVSGGHTYGGYSTAMVVAERFVVRIPPGMDLAATAPLLCAGITTFSPIQHWELSPGQRVGVVGLGGLGHMAVKLAGSRRAEVTVFTTSPGKLADAKRLGAKDAVLSTDADAMKGLAGRFDLVIATVPKAFPMLPFLNVLKPDATLVNVGTLDMLQEVSGPSLVMGRRSIAGSAIGGIAETQEMIDYCAARNIKADVEVIGPGDINRAFDRVVKKDVRYRFVVDMSKTA